MERNSHTVWNNCLAFIKQNLDEAAYTTWFTPIKPVSLDGHVLTIQVPSLFFVEWIETHYLDLLRQVISHELGKQGRLEYFVIMDKGNEKNQPLAMNLPASKPDAAVPGKPAAKTNFRQPAVSPEKTYNESDKYYAQKVKLNPRYTFEAYIEGECNKLARSAGLAIAEKPGSTAFNPLFVYGGVGLGKTHLIQAVGNKIKDQFQAKKVVYVSAQDFKNQFIEAVKRNDTQSFQNFYTKVDVLILDDVQFFEGSDSTQNIFFNIFNMLHQSSRQTLMTSDRPPRDLKGLQDRLLSRFKSGLTVDVQLPEYETRVAIIEKKMQAEGVNIHPEVSQFIAAHVDTNIRELEGVLISLIARASVNRVDIDIDLARKVLKNLIHEMPAEVNVTQIQKTVGEYFGVSVESMSASTRKREIVVARQVAMYFTKELTESSLKTIGTHFGGRDHSTVIHALKAVSELVESKPKFKQDLEDLRKKFKHGN